LDKAIPWVASATLPTSAVFRLTFPTRPQEDRLDDVKPIEWFSLRSGEIDYTLHNNP
jgi:hypothetical protein